MENLKCNYNLGFILAKAILKYNGRISIRQIKALPCIETNTEANSILNLLADTYNLEIKDKIMKNGYLDTEKIIELTS